MEDRGTGNTSPRTTASQSSTNYEDRSVWVLTAYAISGLALFGVLVYYFSTYVTQ